MAGDQQAALFGQGCHLPGRAKNTYGTGCFALVNTGEDVVTSDAGVLTTVAWGLTSPFPPALSASSCTTAAGPYVAYALEGSVFVAGAAVQWLRDGLGVIGSAAEIGRLAAEVSDNGGVYFVPALTGLGAPFWDPYARGLLIGLTRGTTRAHVARATEEAVCCQTRAVFDAMANDMGRSLTCLRVDGGATDDDLLLQLQADLLGIRVERPRIRETTALGAAALAGLAVGFWTQAQVGTLADTERTFEPQVDRESADALYNTWMRAATRSLNWAR